MAEGQPPKGVRLPGLETLFGIRSEGVSRLSFFPLHSSYLTNAKIPSRVSPISPAMNSPGPTPDLHLAPLTPLAAPASLPLPVQTLLPFR